MSHRKFAVLLYGLAAVSAHAATPVIVIHGGAGVIAKEITGDR